MFENCKNTCAKAKRDSVKTNLNERYLTASESKGVHEKNLLAFCAH